MLFLGGILILLILWIHIFVNHQTGFLPTLANQGLHTHRNIFTSKDNNVLMLDSVPSLFFSPSFLAQKNFFGFVIVFAEKKYVQRIQIKF